MSARFDHATLDWEDWVKWEVHHDHQLKMISPEVDLDDAIRRLGDERVFVGLMERFDESLVMFRRLCAPDLNIAYRRENTASDNTIARGLLDDPRSEAQIREMYAGEFPLHEWVTNELFPRYERAYGPSLADDVAAFRAEGQRSYSRFNVLRHKVHQRVVFRPRLARAVRERGAGGD